jgi:hypothetical protein
MFVARHPYIAAVVLHAVLFAVIGFYTIGSRTPKSQPETAAAAPTSTEPSSTGGFTSDNPPFPADQLQAKLDRSMKSADRLSPTEKLTADEYAAQLESLSNVTSMKELGAYLNAASQWKPRPGIFDAGKEKVFDHSSSRPVGARETAPGQYVFVFRDANNNKFEAPVPPGDEAAAKAFALLDRSDVLRELKESVLLPMLNQKLDAAKPAAK